VSVDGALNASQAHMKSASSRRARQPRAKQVAAAPTAEHPEAEVRHVVRGLVRRGLKPLPPKASISLRIDQDVLEWFKSDGPGYETRINTVLRALRDASV
jgi:uncharacterized protein (DUF4415 family)